MARKGKNKRKKNNKKNKRARTNFNKKEFGEIYCQTCLICDNPDPLFCYLSLYKHEPRLFTDHVYNNLIDLNMAYQSQGRSLLSMSVEQFQNVVCRTGICYNGDGYASASCDSIKTCYKEFMAQLGIADAGFVHEDACVLVSFKNNRSKKSMLSYRKQKRKKKKKRVVYTPYPTFFSSPNTEFQEAIRKILYGDNDNQQDKDQELSASDTRAAGGEAEG